MKPNFWKSAALALLAPTLFGCASRTAPFNEMDEASITVLRLQGQYTPTAVATTTAATGLPQLIPGLTIPPELQQMGQQAMQGLQQALPGLIPPGLIPGQPQTTTPTAVTPPPLFKNTYVIATSRQLTTDAADEELREQILDIFGDEDSFSADKGNCFSPGLAISMQRPTSPVPVELLISLSCNQAVGDGFRWPYPTNGFTGETKQKLLTIYQQLFGAVPPDA
ncbi:hypothetical protein [Chondromyces apiculatus]|uniref:Lipoprotein n=1 Tax=Chondromyces apiculatus DSM 436 TaxID=1192034 RepID=A0A017TF26_9BACT|nr:hypothetical protein [Chondromyces apiculatus]EYF07898.1 Hypothetical protein CAP_6920 [Chondromyces apiculatus DSM 436]